MLKIQIVLNVDKNRIMICLMIIDYLVHKIFKTKLARAIHVEELKYYGVKSNKYMSDKKVSKLIDQFAESIYAMEEGLEKEKIREYKYHWRVHKFYYHCDLHTASEIQSFEDFVLHKAMKDEHVLSRGKDRGGSKRITESVSKKVVDGLNAESPKWWRGENRTQIYISKLGDLYPECVDGMGETRKRNKPHKPTNRNQFKKLLILAIIAVVAYFLIKGFYF